MNILLLNLRKKLKSSPWGGFRRGFLFFLLLSISTAKTEIHQAKDVSYGIKTIVIDAGHGGHDGGCQGVYSQEKNVALSIALKLGAYIEKNYPDIKVIYTRKTDVFIELYERANIANTNKADLFVCVHCNANTNKTAYGTETYLMGLDKAGGNLEVSKRENDVVLLENDYLKNYDGFDPNSPEANIIFSLYQSAFIDQSISLASKIEEQYAGASRYSRGVRQANFLVLWRTSMPAILTETGFLTNPTEEKYLNSDAGQNEIAKDIFRGIRAYKNEVEGNPESENQKEVLVPDFAKNLNNPTAPKDTAKIISPIKIPNDTSLAGKKIYRVQLGASAVAVNTKLYPWTGVSDLEEDKSLAGTTRYVAGKYFTLNEAITRKTQLAKAGFPQAFVVAYKNGERLPAAEWNK